MCLAKDKIVIKALNQLTLLFMVKSYKEDYNKVAFHDMVEYQLCLLLVSCSKGGGHSSQLFFLKFLVCNKNSSQVCDEVNAALELL